MKKGIYAFLCFLSFMVLSGIANATPCPASADCIDSEAVSGYHLCYDNGGANDPDTICRAAGYTFGCCKSVANTVCWNSYLNGALCSVSNSVAENISGTCINGGCITGNSTEPCPNDSCGSTSSVCGDKVCDGSENSINCCTDCPVQKENETGYGNWNCFNSTTRARQINVVFSVCSNITSKYELMAIPRIQYEDCSSGKTCISGFCIPALNTTSCSVSNCSACLRQNVCNTVKSIDNALGGVQERRERVLSKLSLYPQILDNPATINFKNTLAQLGSEVSGSRAELQRFSADNSTSGELQKIVSGLKNISALIKKAQSELDDVKSLCISGCPTRLDAGIIDRKNSKREAGVEIYNESGELVAADVAFPGASLKFELESGKKYRIIHRIALSRGLVSVDAKNVSLDKNITLTPEVVEQYSEKLPFGASAKSGVVALNDSSLNYSSAEIILPVSGAVNNILHCTNWDFSGSKCNNWELKPLSYYNGIANATHVRFTVPRFDAFVAVFVPAAADPCIDAPPEYQANCIDLNSWLDQQLSEWNISTYKPMDFGAYHLFASDDMFVKTTEEIDTKFLAAIEETNADTVIIYIRPKTYFANKTRYDSLLDKIRADGKKLFIGARFDDEPMTFASYNESLINYTKNIIAAIKPEYFGIIIEPATMETKYGFSATDEQWAAVVNGTAILSKQLSPGTKTVADGHKEELSFLRMVSNISALDIVGFNIYGRDGIYANYSGYLGTGDVVGNSIEFAKLKGKETWLIETWVADCVKSDAMAALCNMEFRKPIDSKWVRAMAYYAQNHSMKSISPFFTGKFVTYSNDSLEFYNALNAGNRTPVFYEYQTVIGEAGNTTTSPEVKVETICTDGTDNDADGLADSADGDCWIKDGPIYETHPYYYNGTYKSLTAQIPQIADLGVKTIYMLPVWEHQNTNPQQNYLYLITNYSRLDPTYGTEADLKTLVNTTHNYNMKVIFDFVSCCASWTSIPFVNNWTIRISLPELQAKATGLGWNLQNMTDKGTKYTYYNCQAGYGGQNNCDFFGRVDGDVVTAYYYPTVTFGPAIDRTNQDAVNYFINAAEYSVKAYGIDGWRLDVPNNHWNPKIISGDHSSIQMLRDAKALMQANKSNVVFFAELPYLDPSDSALDELSEASYSQGFGKYVLYTIIPGQGSSKELVDLLNLENEQLWYNRTRARMVENHGTQRIANVSPQLDKPLLVMISTIPGVPMIQAGQEIGATEEWFYNGKAQAQVNWSKDDYALREFYKKVFEIRNLSSALKYGDIKNVWMSGDNIFAYSRTYGNETAIVAININNTQATSYLNLSFANGARLKDELSGDVFIAIDPANFKISVPAYGARILTIYQKNISQIKTVVQYRYVTDWHNRYPYRNISAIIGIFNETKADMVFQSWLTQNPLSDKCSDLPIANQSQCNAAGYSYEYLVNATTAIKDQLPEIMFGGGTQFEYFYPGEVSGATEQEQRDKAWNMTLNPAKWGLSMTRGDAQCYFAKMWGIVGKADTCPSEAELKQTLTYYFPDITNYDFQQLFLSRIYRQIDAGADVIWIDGFYGQPWLLGDFAANTTHPAVLDSYNAAWEIIDKIHAYGQSKGKYIYIITWVAVEKQGTIQSAPKTNADIAMLSPDPDEIRNQASGAIGQFNESKWDVLASYIKTKYGIPIYARIDYGGNWRSALGAFSQELSPAEAGEFLKLADAFFAGKNITFIYPVHGGDMIPYSQVSNASYPKNLSYGKYNWYDSMAPEFDTYSTIVGLAQNTTSQAAAVSVETICTDGKDNDGDGLVDGADGDCWIRGGPIYGTHPEFYGGTLRNITAQVPGLAKLGVQTIYILPIWEHNDNYLYSVLDYYSIDPRYGTGTDLIELVNTAHNYNMKVILDLVTSYTPENGVIYTQHPEYLLYNTSGEIEYGWPHEWGPSIDRANTEAQEYFANVSAHYIETYNIDGWRVDAPQNNYNPADVSGEHDAVAFFRNIKSTVISAKPGAILFGEWYGTKTDWGAYTNKNTTEFDEMFEFSHGWLFREWIRNELLSPVKTSKEFVDFISSEKIGHNRTRSRFIEDQNVPRMISYLNASGRLGAIMPAAAIEFTIPGIPYIHAGQEIGESTGRTAQDPFPQVNWSSGNYSIREFYEKIAAIRNNSNALKYGDIKNVWASGDNAYAYSRTYGDETVIAVINLNNKSSTAYLNVSFASGTGLTDKLSGETFKVSDSKNFQITVPAYGSRILTVMQKNLSQVKVAVVYERLMDAMQNDIGRNISNVSSIFNETNTEMIFRGWWREFPTADSCGQLPLNLRSTCEQNSISYEHFRNATSAVKSKNPDIIIIGSIAAQRINIDLMNNVTGEVSGPDIMYPETWSLALDPAKWGIKSVSKISLQCTMAEQLGFMGTNTDCATYDPAKANAYLPDLANPKVQEIMKAFIDKQMQAGADGMWIDGLQANAQLMLFITGNANHTAVKDTTKAVDDIVNWFHAKYPGKAMGSWTGNDLADIPAFAPKFDFVSLPSFSKNELLSLQINETAWDQKIAAASKFGNVPMITFIDWGWGESPMYYFSQNLTAAQQSEFLQIADEFFKKKGVIFAYPVHGAFLGHDAIILAYGKHPYYDSMAPEFNTYDTIKDLAACGNGICESGECDSCAFDCGLSYVLPDNLTAEYAEAYENMSAWLNSKLVEWKPASYAPMHFMGFVVTLTESYIGNTTIDDDLKFVDMLDEAGADIITIPITGAPEDISPDVIGRYDALISDIRNRGLELKVWSQSYIYPANIRVQKMNSSAQYIISRWHPEYYTVVHEPECDTPQGMQTNKETIEGLVSIAKSIDPGVKVNAGVLAYSKRMDCIDYYVNITGLDTVSIDVYGKWGLCEDCDGGNAIEGKINLTHSKGKDVWFEEFWSSVQWDKSTPDVYDMVPGFNDPKRAWWDSQFIKMISYYAQKNKMIGVEPWFTNNFFLYPGYYPWDFSTGEQRPNEQFLKDLRVAMDGNRRTPTFCAFKNAIEEVKNGSGVIPEKNLSDINVAVVYERLLDMRPNRTIDEHIQIFNDTKTDLVFRAWWRWNPVPKSCSDFAVSQQAGCYNMSYSYDHMQNATGEIRKKIPNIIFVGSVPAQRVVKTEFDPSSKQYVYYPETWSMALDPAKWGLAATKNDLQCNFAKSQFWYSGDCAAYNPANVEAYFPDITNPQFQDLFLASAKMQIDAGADAIWIDLFYEQSKQMYSITKDANHPAVRDAMGNVTKLINEIRDYGASKGKYIYIGSWIPPDFYGSEKLDFVTSWIAPAEISAMAMNETLWDMRVNMTRERVGNVSMFAFFDWGWGDTGPLAVFSQNLTAAEQSQFLKIADEFFKKKNITFIYPVHGGDLGENPKTCAYGGAYCWYDALAPEFDTYGTIKELAMKKKGLLPQRNLSDVKVAVVYERIADQMQNDIGRNTSAVITLLNDTKADLVLRVWWNQRTVENCSQAPTQERIEQCINSSYSYAHLKNATGAIKKQMPDIIFIGAVPSQELGMETYDYNTHKFVRYPESWNLAFDPEKFGIPKTKSQFQCEYAKRRSWLNQSFDCNGYDPTVMDAYFPDITNSSFQALLLGWAHAQLDSGAEGIWFDALFSHAAYIAKLTNDTNHPAVSAAFNASSSIIDEVHKYKPGAYVGTWGSWTPFPYPAPDVDFVTVTPATEETQDRAFNETNWDALLTLIREKKGNVPIFAFIDWADTSNTPLGTFSQNMSREDQRSFLAEADSFFSKKGVVFSYPLHGGYLGYDAQILAYGKHPYYDSSAPEFNTYGTIKQLASAKHGICYSSEPGKEISCSDSMDNDCDGFADANDTDCVIGQCASAPPENLTMCLELDVWLNQKLVEWKPVNYTPMDFGAYHTLASYPNVISVDADLINNYTSALEESGIDTVVIYMHGTPFLLNNATILSRWDSAVNKIKADKKKLYIAYIPDVAGSGLIDWATYQSVQSAAIQNITARYSPDIMAVLNEPTTVERSLSFNLTAQEWADLVNTSANLAKKNNPNIKTVIHITGGDLPYFSELIKPENLDEVGFNIYGYQSVETFVPYIDSVKLSGKTATVSETWKMFKGNQDYDWGTSIDEKWIKVLTYYAQENNMTFIYPFFTFYYFTVPADVRNETTFLSTLDANIAAGNRTATFYTYENVISEVRNNTGACAGTPAEMLEWCINSSAWLDQKIIEWKPIQNSSILFNGHMIFTSEDLVDQSNPEFDAKFLDMLNELDIDTISFFITPTMYQKYETRYADIFSKVRALNKKIYVSYVVDVKYASFSDYRNAEMDFINTFVGTYHPDYFTVVDEETTMEKRSGIDATDAEWKGLVIDATTIVKSISPQTKTVVNGHSLELDFLKSLVDVGDLDYVGFSLWGTKLIDNTTSEGKNIQDTIRYLQSNGKQVIFEQTWVLNMETLKDSGISDFRFMSDLDVKYVAAMEYYAILNNITLYSPFYAGKFVTYNTDTVAYQAALDGGNRTPAFYTYKGLIAETKLGRDKTPPSIYNTALKAGSTSANISWETDEPANSEITYSTSADTLGVLWINKSAHETLHEIKLADLLVPGTIYYLQIYGADEAGNRGQSKIYAFKTTKPVAANLTFDESDGVISIYDINGTAIDTKPKAAELQLEDGTAYDIIFSATNGTLKIKKLNITGNVSLSLRIIADYAGVLPAGTYIKTPIMALNDTSMIYELAEIHLPAKSIPNRIMHCTEFDFTSNVCYLWELLPLSFYGAEANSTELWFNVTGFDAYGGGYSSAPVIAEWYNNVSKDMSLSIAANKNQSILFNATADQAGDYMWYKNGTIVGSAQEYIYLGAEAGTWNITVSINNSNGRNAREWSLSVTDPACMESWSCNDWSACTGTQVRTCTDSNACGTTLSKPAESQSCTPTTSPPPDNGGGSGGDGGTPQMHPKIELSLYPSEIRIAQNSSMGFTIKVSNTGDITLYGLYLSAENTWFYFDESKFNLKKNESRDMDVTINVPLSAEPGSYSSVINIMGGAGDSKAMNLTVYALGTENGSIEDIVFIDREKLRQDIEALELEISRLASEGYNVTDAQKIILDAKKAYNEGNDAKVINYLSMTANALKNPKKITGFFAYPLAALAILLIVVAAIFLSLTKRNAKKKSLIRQAFMKPLLHHPENMKLLWTPAKIICWKKKAHQKSIKKKSTILRAGSIS